MENVNEDGIPLSPEGIPLDMIGHYPSHDPPINQHAVNLPDDSDPMNQEYHSAATFRQAFDQQVATGEKFIVIFLGSVVPSTGQSWCPHCV